MEEGDNVLKHAVLHSDEAECTRLELPVVSKHSKDTGLLTGNEIKKLKCQIQAQKEKAKQAGFEEGKKLGLIEGKKIAEQQNQAQLAELNSLFQSLQADAAGLLVHFEKLVIDVPLQKYNPLISYIFPPLAQFK